MTNATTVSKKVKTNKEVIAAAPAVANSETIAVQLPPTKADKARVVFAEMFAMPVRPARKDMISRAVAEAGLTKAGAATYLQNYKNKNNLSVKRTPASA